MKQNQFRLLETSLNLRIEGAHTSKAYRLDGSIATIQLNYEPDVIVNVEDMEECDRAGYDDILRNASYNRIAATDDRHKRGVSCWVKNEYHVEKVHYMTDPHFLHVLISNNNTHINMIIVRILVRSSWGSPQVVIDSDYRNRCRQWDCVMKYIDDLKDKSSIVLAGDLNHGVISEKYPINKARRYYNYHMICNDLKQRNIPIVPIDGYSKDGYLTIDHIAASKNIEIVEAKYEDPFDHLGTQKERSKRIGTPDHSVIFSILNVCS